MVSTSQVGLLGVCVSTPLWWASLKVPRMLPQCHLYNCQEKDVESLWLLDRCWEKQYSARSMKMLSVGMLSVRMLSGSYGPHSFRFLGIRG